MTQQEMITWLSREEQILYGECKGPLLDQLIEKGLARTNINPPDDWAYVYLTPRGWRQTREKIS